MTTQMENMKAHWEKYTALSEKLKDENIDIMLEMLGERVLMCPASQRETEHGSHPGGLVEHSLKVAYAMKSINEALNMGVSTASILKVGLLHEIGKIGDEESSLFVDQDSDWHREKLGQNYKYNENLQKMSVSHRTLYLLQKFGVKLSQDEWIAIQIAPGSHYEENRFYVNAEPAIAILLQKAKSLVIHQSTAS